MWRVSARQRNIFPWHCFCIINKNRRLSAVYWTETGRQRVMAKLNNVEPLFSYRYAKQVWVKTVRFFRVINTLYLPISTVFHDVHLMMLAHRMFHWPVFCVMVLQSGTKKKRYWLTCVYIFCREHNTSNQALDGKSTCIYLRNYGVWINTVAQLPKYLFGCPSALNNWAPNECIFIKFVIWVLF